MKDGDRLKLLISLLRTSVPLFAKSLDYSSDSLYNIIKGRYRISPKLADKILEEYPEINPEWLKEGRGKMIIDESKVDPLLLEALYPKTDEPSLDYNKSTEIEILKKERELLVKTIEEQKEEIRFLRDMLKQAKK
ncbi:MAG: hypothetical protein JRJ57_00350 [Deltaproteobacteria bacterium]|nr:hypothetical protein [Deltaproteobacteria bacterium]